jgi:hypothetical protein
LERKGRHRINANSQERQTKVGLRRRMPLFSKRLDKAESFLMVTRLIRHNPILKIPRHQERSG